MGTKNHQDITSGAPAAAATFNAPLGQLDDTIVDIEQVFGDYVITGGLAGTSASLVISQPVTRVFIGGQRVSALAQNLTVTASSDNYVDLDTAGIYHVTPVATGALPPPIFANSIRLEAAIANATAVTAINDWRPTPLPGIFINVKASPYNAKGDGTVDDTAAVQSALSALNPNGGTVYFPPGNYKVSATLNVNLPANGFRLMGAGRDKATITFITQNMDCLKITLNPGRIVKVAIEGLQLIGPGAGTSGYGINLEGDLALTRSTVRSFWTNVRLTNSFYSQFQDSELASAVQDGLFLDASVTTFTGLGSRYSGSGRYGIYSPGTCYHMRLVGDFLENNLSRGLYVDGTSGFRFVIHLEGVYFENNNVGTQECYVGPTSPITQLNMIGCRFTDQPTGTMTHCQIVGCSSALLMGNYFGDASGAGGKSLQLDAGAKGVIEIGNYYYLSPVRTAGAIGFILGQPLGQAGTPGVPLAHARSYGPAPAISGVNAGISGTPTVSGNDRSGTITLTTTGAGVGAGSTLFTVTFATTYNAAPSVVICQNSAAGTADITFVVGSTGAGSFTIDNIQALAASKTYTIGYIVEEHN